MYTTFFHNYYYIKLWMLENQVVLMVSSCENHWQVSTAWICENVVSATLLLTLFFCYFPFVLFSCKPESAGWIEWVQGAWKIGLQSFHLELWLLLLQMKQQLHRYQYKAQLPLSQMLLNPTFTWNEIQLKSRLSGLKSRLSWAYQYITRYHYLQLWATKYLQRWENIQSSSSI